MSFALSSGVTGLQAHQQMLDVAGNNLANVNTTAFKSSRIQFSELLSETIKKASQPSTDTGGTNPVQMGSGVGVSGIVRNMSQGNIVNTGNPLDLAIEGEGYFELKNVQQSVYTRAGAFGVDEKNFLVDPATGYRVQRYGSEGEADLFQTAGNNNVHVPYDVPMKAKATSAVTVAGNLSTDAVLATPLTNVMTTNKAFTLNNGTLAADTAGLDTLDQFTAGTLNNATITVSGFNHAGTALSGTTKLTASDAFTVSSAAATGTTALSALDQYAAGASGTFTSATITVSGLNHGGTALVDASGLSVTGTSTINDLITHINTVLDAGGAVGANGSASLVNGKIVVTDATGGHSSSAITLTFANSGTATVTMPTSFAATGPLAVTPTTTIGDLITHINTVLDDGGAPGANGVATLVNGKIVVTDAESGYSKSDIGLTFANTGGTAALRLPTYFEMTTVGGEEVKNVNITVYDSDGGQHVLSGAFVRSNTPNTWDMVLSSITGDIAGLTPGNRRIEGIQFNAADGSYKGLDELIGDKAQFVVSFAKNPLNPQTIGISLGQMGQLDGLTQFAGNSTAVAREQDGYSDGRLSTVSVNNEGLLIGAFSNGVKKNICALQIALFQNTSGLENIGGNYFIPSANSGTAVATQALTGGAGSVHGGSLEKSNADVATEFVNLINAQNGFQANSRTIRVATDILAELATLIR
jgi:flagellar hook protein FlgE